MVPFYGDYDTTETVYLPLNTFDSNDPSQSVTITNLANTDIHIHKDGGTTQRSSAAGVTASIDFDTITGNHLVSIDLSDNTDAGFYATGSIYQVRMEGTTVDAGTINAWIGSFSIGRRLTQAATANLELQYDTTGLTGDTFPATQAQVGNLSVGSGGISTTSNSDTTVTTGTETLTYTATAQLDGSYHEIAQAASAIEMYYEFTVGGNGVPQSVEWTGYVQTNNDNLEVYFRNWAGASWDQVGTIAGSAGTTPVSEQFIATTAHVGTGADLGKVRFRMASSGADVATVLATDRILATYTVVSQSVGYADGAVWLDTNLSNTSTESFVDGVADNPVSTIAAALTIAGNVGLKRIHSAAGSSWTMAADFSSYELMGQNYTIAFNGQTITGAQITGATLSGTFTNTNAILEDCIINAITGPGCTMRRCFFNDVTITNNGTVGWFLNDCRSRVAGTGSPNFDFGAAVGASSLNMRDYSGGIELENMATGDTASIEGQGAITINANCTAGSLARRGSWDYNDNAGGVVTVTPDDESANIVTIDTVVDGIQTDITALNDISVADILTTQMTEAYAADGVAPTLAQAMFLIQQTVGQFSISGTTLTAQQIDKSTTAATYTLDDASNPTSRTRAT